MYRLISATPSPFARKVRIQLLEKGIDFELVTEVPWNDDTRTPLHNPLEKLPILICEDGESLFDSRYINEWIELHHPEPPLVPRDVDGLLAVKKFEVIADGICDAMVLMFIEGSRAEEKQSPEWIARQRRKIEGGIRDLSRTIGDKPFAFGDSFSLADVACGTALKYISLRGPQIEWQTLHPNLASYSRRLEERPSFASTTPVTQTIQKVV